MISKDEKTCSAPPPTHPRPDLAHDFPLVTQLSRADYSPKYNLHGALLCNLMPGFHHLSHGRLKSNEHVCWFLCGSSDFQVLGDCKSPKKYILKNQSKKLWLQSIVELQVGSKLPGFSIELALPHLQELTLRVEPTLRMKIKHEHYFVFQTRAAAANNIAPPSPYLNLY